MSIDPAAVTTRLFDVRGRRAVVTGAASGLGLAAAEVLAECGARVTLADIDSERLAEQAGRLSAGGCDVRTAVVDVTDDASVRAAFADAAAAYGGLDIVFANAGIAAVPGYANAGGQELHMVAEDAWRKVIGVNLDGVLSTMRAAAGVMKPQGSGRIVVTASTAGLRADPMVCYGYIASKAAVVNVARQAALELAPHGVHVNVIAPGPIKTRIGGRRHAGVGAAMGGARAARAHGRARGAEGSRPDAGIAGRELHHGRRDHDRRRPVARRAGRLVGLLSSRG